MKIIESLALKIHHVTWLRMTAKPETQVSSMDAGVLVFIK
jgi:hypothetical protein